MLICKQSEETNIEQQSNVSDLRFVNDRKLSALINGKNSKVYIRSSKRNLINNNKIVSEANEVKSDTMS
jgi:hypothetical protein